MTPDDQEKRARESTFHYLSYRPRSISEVRTFLLEKEYEKEIVDSVIDALSETKFLDDHQFATWWTESRIRGGKSGPIRVRQELTRKGISKEIIDEALKHDWKKISRDALEKAAGKIHERDSKKRIQKLQSFLARSGFTWDQIRAAVDPTRKFE